MLIKTPTTYEEQLDILRNHGCVISDEPAAEDFLKHTGYYRLSGYFSAFRESNVAQGRHFIQDTTFEKLAAVYNFDQELRVLILRAVSQIELAAKSMISYHHGIEHGSLGYMDANTFNTAHNHDRFVKQFQTAIKNNRNNKIVKHHLKNYDGDFPIWAATELFTMGMISFFFADLKTEDKKAIAREYHTDYVHLQSWLHSASVLRNISAHYGRLYHATFYYPPKLPRSYLKNKVLGPDSLGRQLCMLKLLHASSKERWNSTFVTPLTALIEEYGEMIDLSSMGLPADWEKLLAW